MHRIHAYYLLTLLLLCLLVSPEVRAQQPSDRFNPEAPDMNYLIQLTHDRINSFRQKKKIAALSLHDDLNAAALLHADYLKKKGKLDHFQNKAQFRTPVERVGHYNREFKYIGENVAYVSVATIQIRGKSEEMIYKTCQEMTEELVTNWLKSKPHLKNISDKTYTHTGIALVYDSAKSRIYAVQVFAAR